MRKFIGALVGIVVGIVVQGVIGYASALVYPQPAIDMRNRQQVAESFANASTGTLLFYLASFFFAALLAAWAARLIARSKAVGWVAAGVMALMALVIAIFYPDPAWAQFGAFGTALFGGLIGCHLPAGAEPVAAATADADDGV